MTSRRRNLLLLWDLGFISFRLWLNEHFFFTTRYFYHYCNSNWQHNGTTVCGHKKKSKYHSTSITVLQCDYQSRLLKTSKKKTQHLKKLAKFYAHKSKKYRGRWAITWALSLIASHFNQKYFLNVHSFPFAASYCIYSFCSSYCSVGSFLQLNNAFMVHFYIIKMLCWVNDEESWTNHWGTCPLLHCVGQTIHKMKAWPSKPSDHYSSTSNPPATKPLQSEPPLKSSSWIKRNHLPLARR